VANGVKDMDKELKEIIADLTKRLEFLERHDRQAEAAAVMEGQNTVDQRAQFLALYSIVQELSDREGVSEVQFLEHFQKRVPHYRDYLLRIAENINPNWSGQIDARDLSEVPEDESYPPMFPEGK
jgi:hypothetical protein